MAITNNPTNPRGTKRPLKNPVLEYTNTFRSIIVINCPCNVNLPLNIQFNNAYNIFSLFFNNEVLNILIKNINTYGAHHHMQLKAT